MKTKPPLESAVESYLINQCKKRGWLTYKWSSPSNAGVPDRIVIRPGGHVVFVEVKRDGGAVTPLQAHVHNKLTAVGARVIVATGKGGVDRFIAELEIL